ncbi:hypothetical protein D9M68_837290 [compost metagenome]
MRDIRQADRFDRLGKSDSDAAGRIAHETLPEGKIFCDGQFALHRVAMPEIVAELRWVSYFWGGVLKFQMSAFGAQQPGQNPQQSRLSRAVRTRHHKGLTGIERKGNIVKNQILAALRTQTFSQQAHEY